MERPHVRAPTLLLDDQALAEPVRILTGERDRVDLGTGPDAAAPAASPTASPTPVTHGVIRAVTRAVLGRVRVSP
ncbi:hypothetical protein ACFV9C_09535 [Kribbella sp. NPDC059898]|uniref:hypothetical protein n=1 Tax=Kribbella sp. NPDC059898 TaxID=3346995 RepID=UPI003646B448